MIETGEGLVPVEIKSTGSPGRGDLRGLLAFREEYEDRFLGGLLLHEGENVQWLAEGLLAAPWHRVV